MMGGGGVRGLPNTSDNRNYLSDGIGYVWGIVYMMGGGRGLPNTSDNRNYLSDGIGYVWGIVYMMGGGSSGAPKYK